MDSEDKTSADVREGNPPAPTKGEESKPPVENGAKPADGDPKGSDRPDKNKKSAKDKCSKKHSKGKSGKSKKSSSPAESDSDSDSDDSANETSSSSSDDDSQAETARSKKKRVAKKRKPQEPQKTTKKTRAKKQQKKATKTAEPSESDYDSDSSEVDGSDSSDDENAQLGTTDLLKQIQLLLLQQQQQQPPPHHQQSHQLHHQQPHQSTGSSYAYPSGLNTRVSPPIYDTGLRHNPPRARRGGARLPGRGNLNAGGVDPNLLQQQKDKKQRPKASKLDYKRVDQVWDDTIHNYKLQDTAERTVDAQYDEFIFHVRRTFDWEGKYKTTIVDIKSKLLRECLQDVIGDIKGISLVDDTPKLDPNMLFL